MFYITPKSSVSVQFEAIIIAKLSKKRHQDVGCHVVGAQADAGEGPAGQRSRDSMLPSGPPETLCYAPVLLYTEKPTNRKQSQ